MSRGPVLPGACLGLLGGGQLGRMTALAARTMGYGVLGLDPDPACALRPVADEVLTAGFDAVEAARALARRCGAVTLEIEQIHPEVLAAVAAEAPLRPGPAVVTTIQHRSRQKAWLAGRGFPVGPFAVAEDAEALGAAVAALGPSIAKSVHGGYDGRGQRGLSTAQEAPGVWAALGGAELLVERRLALAAELSVLVARRPGGALVVYPPSLNHHTRGVLTWALTPAPLPTARLAAAQQLAREIAEALQVEGLLAVELFLTEDGALLVNELAPRPHNTYHHSPRAFATGQFEQLVRAVCDLPLGSVELLRPAAVVNLLGEVWLQAQPPDFAAALEVPGVRLHLYGKAEARPGRKMGHLSAVGEHPAQALERVLLAYRRFSPGTVGSVDVHPPALPNSGIVDPRVE